MGQMIESLINLLPENLVGLNGSILPKDRSYLFIFRELINEKYYGGRIMWTHLDDRFRFVHSPQRAPLIDGCEDPRIVRNSDGVYLTYTRLEGDHLFHQYICRVECEGDNLSVKEDLEMRLHQKDNRPIHRQHEKNWMPFCRENRIYFVHSINPHTVVKWGNGTVTEVYTTSPIELDWTRKFGAPRGGSNALRFEDSYIAFFHSSIYLEGDSSVPDAPRQYFMGAYVFDADPPFRIKAVSSNPIESKYFFSRVNRISPHRVIFPMSLWKEDQYFFLTAGDMDCGVILLRIRVSSLLSSLSWF